MSMDAPRTRVVRRPVHGVLLIDKPLGMTSTHFAPLAEADTVLLTSYRRDGTPVGTPVHVVVRDEPAQLVGERLGRSAGIRAHDERDVRVGRTAGERPEQRRGGR